MVQFIFLLLLYCFVNLFFFWLNSKLSPSTTILVKLFRTTLKLVVHNTSNFIIINRGGQCVTYAIAKVALRFYTFLESVAHFALMIRQFKSCVLLRCTPRNKKTACALLRCTLKVKRINCALYSSILQKRNLLFVTFQCRGLIF